MRSVLPIISLFVVASTVVSCGEVSPDPASTHVEPAALRADRRTSVALPGPNFYPEGIAAAPDGALYVGSIGTGAIVRVPPRSEETEVFLPARPMFAVYGMAVDAARRTLWACTYDDALLPAQPAALAGYHLDTGALVASYVMPGDNGFCNDVAIDAQGNVYATDSFANTVVRLRAGVLETWADHPLFRGAPGAITLNGIAFDRRRDRFYVIRSDNGALFTVPIECDGRSGSPAVVSVDGSFDLADGVEIVDDDTLLVVENGGYVSLLELGRGGAHKTAIKSGLREPTTAAIDRGGSWVVESQLSHLFGNPGGPVLPFFIKRVSLPHSG